MYIHDSGHALMTKFLDDQFLAIHCEYSRGNTVTKTLIILFLATHCGYSGGNTVTKTLIILFLSHPLWVFGRKYCD